jgi:protein-S-isoprenylcysteine O-methyltransferase Ste14
MSALSFVILACWVVFWVYWLTSAIGAKKNNYSGIRQALKRQATIRLIIFAAVLLFLRLSPSHSFNLRDYGPVHNNYLQAGGLAILLLGLLFAIWARRNLGKNWGMPMTLKQDPELVTSGPYRYVRHPIYSGILLAIIGTAIAINLAWLFILMIAGAYFVYSALVEERIMLKEFPKTYPAYKRQTKMLIPFVL